MFNSLLHGRRKIKQSQRLMLLSREAKRIRELHQAGKITAAEAADQLIELRDSPENALLEMERRQSADAA